jgi:hypothetical protein
MPISNLLSFRSWSLTGLTPTWKGQPLYYFLQINGGEADLPDHSKKDENKIDWTAGALDGVTSHHLFDPEGGEKEQGVTEVVRALEAFLKRATEDCADGTADFLCRGPQESDPREAPEPLQIAHS